MRAAVILLSLGIACQTTTKAVIEPSESAEIVQDLDGDGYDSDEDCDDSSELINPGATELCDGQDNNCDDQIDEGVLSTFYADADGDGFGDPEIIIEACEAPVGAVPNANDCDDNDPQVFPSNSERCDGIDNDCNGEIDDGVGDIYYVDSDQDGFGLADSPTFLCQATEGYASVAGDCDDRNNTVNPDATEVCDDQDNDCNGSIDENVTNTYYADTDGDGFGDSAAAIDACERPFGAVENDSDCDDSQSTSYPGAIELCDNEDNDCDGNIDEVGTSGLITHYTDADGDGYGDPTTATTSCSLPAGAVTDGSDCDDAEALSNPGEQELCDGIDNDCDGSIDDADSSVVGTSNWWLDHDSDGYGDAAFQLTTCSQPTGYVSNSDDCDDLSSARNPQAAEVCDGIDNDCDTAIDDLDSNLQLSASDIWYFDGDGDGFGANGSQINSCVAPSGSYVQISDDCDDTDPASNPNEIEICDTADNDCDGIVDESLNFTVYADSDGDGFGDSSATSVTCQLVAGYATNSGDCDDNNAAINPNATEVCDNADNNCNGITDEGHSSGTYYRDTDGDGFGDPNAMVIGCFSANVVSNTDDCDDLDPNTTWCEDCAALNVIGWSSDGLYTIDPGQLDQPFEAYCDMGSEGGGWTLVGRQLPSQQLTDTTADINVGSNWSPNSTFRYGNSTIQRFVPSTAWRITSESSFGVIVDNAWFQPSCVVDWGVYVGTHANVGSPTLNTDCGIAYTDYSFSQGISPYSTYNCSRGIGQNNDGNYCSIRMGSCTFGAAQQGAATPCNVGQVGTLTLSLWAK